MKHIGLLMVAVVAGSYAPAGWGSEPTQATAAPSPAEASAAPAPTAPAASAVPAEAASAPTAPAASAVPAEVVPASTASPASGVPVETAHAPKLSPKVPGGYRLVKRNGKELYCKSVTTIGTRFAEQMCFTREQIAEIDERTNHAMDDFEKARKTCTGGAYCTEM
jgi:cytoskeletal protein RodZ